MVKGIVSLEFPQSHNLTRKVSTVDTFDDLQDVTASNNNVGIGEGASILSCFIECNFRHD